MQVRRSAGLKRPPGTQHWPAHSLHPLCHLQRLRHHAACLYHQLQRRSVGSSSAHRRNLESSAHGRQRTRTDADQFQRPCRVQKRAHDSPHPTPPLPASSPVFNRFDQSQACSHRHMPVVLTLLPQVHFAHPQQPDRPSVSGLSFTVRPGTITVRSRRCTPRCFIPASQTVFQCIVGPSNCGKSVVPMLLARL